jgi:hypothetical protein
MILKGIYSFIKAIMNAPDTQHWINKYESAKRDNDELRKKLQEEIKKKENLKRLLNQYFNVWMLHTKPRRQSEQRLEEEVKKEILSD